MSWPLSQLQIVFVSVVFVSILLPAAEQRGRPERRRRFWQKRKAELVASRIVRVVHACRSAGTHAGPP
jgi:hypothetical protein